MLYAPYRVDENCFKEQYLTWNNAYMELQDVIKQNEQKFTYKTTKRWGDLEDAANELDRVNEQLFNVYDDQQDKAYNKDLCSKDNSQNYNISKDQNA